MCAENIVSNVKKQNNLFVRRVDAGAYDHRCFYLILLVNGYFLGDAKSGKQKTSSFSGILNCPSWTFFSYKGNIEVLGEC